MSDFDKEAERERLREKYERDEEKRKVTERMSELLLKGATMTNAHCQDCGDPIFRYDGQEFCATCEKTVSRERDDQDAEGAEESTEEAGPEELEVATPDETRVQFGDGEADPNGDEPAAREDQPDGRTPQERPTDPDEPVAGEDVPEPGGVEPAANAHGRASTLDDASASLVRSVTELARRAEATEDLGRKRDLLGATREAADALAAVREASR